MSNALTLQRLTKRAQFLFVRNGARAARPNVLIEARRRAEAGPVGLGLTASKKVGGAVARNRARRRLREAARRLLPELGLAGVDYVLVARQTTPDAPWAALLDDVGNALIRLRADLENGRGRSPRGRAPARRGSSTESD
jgi:ribonuclease P protein component